MAIYLICLGNSDNVFGRRFTFPITGVKVVMSRYIRGLRS